MATSRQTTFSTPCQKASEILRRVTASQYDTVSLTVSGGTDSVLAAVLASELGADLGIDPGVVLHANTGVAIPQTQLTAMLTAHLVGVPYVEGNNGTVGPRVFEHGNWPAATSEGHFIERIERKTDVFDKFYSSLPGKQLWISGARATESKQRSTNVPDSGIAPDSRHADKTWCSPITGLTSEEKGEMILELGLPVSEAYLFLGISGECVACSYDDAGLLTDLDLIAPELAWALRVVTVTLAMLAARGAVDLSPKQLCWGWDPATDDIGDSGQVALDGDRPREDEWIGCSDAQCGERSIPDWVQDLPDWQIVDRSDVLKWWQGRTEEVVDRFKENSEVFG